MPINYDNPGDIFVYGSSNRSRVMAISYGDRDHIIGRTTLGSNPLEVAISPSQRPLPDNTQHSQEKAMPPAKFEPTNPTSDRQQTHALHIEATAI